jgi:hypothetical protein
MDGINLEKENNNLQITKCHFPLEAPRSPQEAMRYLSRTWSPSSSTYVDQLLSAKVSFSKEICLVSIWDLKNLINIIEYTLKLYNALYLT